MKEEIGNSIEELFKSATNRNEGVVPEVSVQDDRICHLHIYITKGEIENAVKSKLSEKDKNKHISLTDVDWHRNHDGSVALYFNLCEDKDTLEEYVEKIFSSKNGRLFPDINECCT